MLVQRVTLSGIDVVEEVDRQRNVGVAAIKAAVLRRHRPDRARGGGPIDSRLRATGLNEQSPAQPRLRAHDAALIGALGVVAACGLVYEYLRRRRSPKADVSAPASAFLCHLIDSPAH